MWSMLMLECRWTMQRGLSAARLKHCAIPILPSRVVTGQMSAAEMFPLLLGLSQAEVADQVIALI